MKLISLISGGIDSPVATYLMMRKLFQRNQRKVFECRESCTFPTMRKNADIVGVYFDNRPFCDEKSLEKATKLVEKLEKVFNKKIKIYIVPHGNNLSVFAESCRENLECVLCKRMMLRIGEKIAKTENAYGLVTGESLGQVASQTLENIYVTNNTVKIPILRPLIGFDKIEIEKIAKETGLYEISIIPCLPCSAVPKKPSTKAKLENVLNEEEKVDINSLVEESLMNAVIR